MPQLTADLIYGFTQTFLLGKFDNPRPTPEFHRELWELVTRPDPQVAIAAPRNHAKAQSLSSKVLTPSGWTTIGNLKIGDQVIGGNGTPKKVTHVHPISEMELYRVTTADGKSTLCNLDHLWNVEIPSNQKGMQTKSLREILQNWKSKRKNGYTEYRYRIPAPAPVEYSTKFLDIDPYVFGAWLGDGHSAGARFTTNDPEIFTYFPYSVEKQSGKYGYVIREIYSKLKALNVLNNKHIPDQFFFGSIEQRLALLQGLFDTDGTCHKQHGQVSFCNTNKQLVDGVVSLVRSLGGIATVSTGFPSKGKQYWKVSVKLAFCPFRLQRKRELWTPSNSLYSYLVSIEQECTNLGRCITVEDNTYITDDYLLTHNSTAITHSYVLAAVCFRDRHHVLIVSDTEEQAKQFLGDIKAEFIENQDLTRLFNIKRIVKDTETEVIIEFQDGKYARLIAKGSEQKLRGVKWRNKRPDLIICDDLENDEIVMNEDRREKFRRWFYNALLPAGSDNALYRVVGTILHLDSTLERLMPPLGDPDTVVEGLKQYSKSPRSWLSVRYKAHNDDFSEILWPERFTRDFFVAKREDYVHQGFPEGYSQEYLNYPIDEATAYFRKNDFLPIEDRTEYGEYYIAGDLAISEQKRRAYSVFAVAKMLNDYTLQVVDIRRFRGDAYELLDEIFALNSRYKPEIFFLEQENIARTLSSVLYREMEDRGQFINIELLSPLQDKIKRARPLQARMRAGKVQFDTEAEWYPTLQQELLQFPRGAYKDQVDALAWIPLGMDKVFAVPDKYELEEMEYEEEMEESFNSLDFGRSAVTGY